MRSVYDTIQAVRADMNRILLEREGAIDNAFLALLTRQHYLQVGGPGTAKSMLVNALHVRIVNGRRFKRFCNPGTTADEIVGPQDLLALADHGRHCRIHKRSAVEADIIFFDEIGRANQLAYDVMVQLLGEEREVDELGMDDVLHLPLISAFGASNSHLLDKNLEALNNRFLLRDIIVGVQERASKIRLATNPPKTKDVQATMTLDDLIAAQTEAQQVRGNAEVLDAALDLEAHLRTEGIEVTDRMWTWSFPLMKAHAWLHGASELSLEDLGVVASAWWSDPKDRQRVQRAIYAVANPLEQRALEMEDDCLDLLKHLPAPQDPDFKQAGEDLNVTLVDKIETLDREIKTSHARDKRQAIRSLQRIWSAQEQHAANYGQHTKLGRVKIDRPSALVA